MKKINIKIGLFILIGMLLGDWVVNAQVQYRPRRVEVYVFAGPTISWLSTTLDGYKNDGASIGGAYGINTDINLVPTEENYYFSTGLNLRHTAGKLSYKDVYTSKSEEKVLDAKIKSKYNTIYLSIPTTIKLKTNPFGRFIISGVVGLEHGICLKSLEHNEITRPNGSGFKEKNINKYKQTAVIKESMYICFGFEFIIKDNTRASFGLAYDRGLNGMFRKKYQNTITKESVKAHYNSFEFQFGFIF